MRNGVATSATILVDPDVYGLAGREFQAFAFGGHRTGYLQSARKSLESGQTDSIAWGK